MMVRTQGSQLGCLLQLNCLTLDKFTTFLNHLQRKGFNVDVLGGPFQQVGNERQAVDNM